MMMSCKYGSECGRQAACQCDCCLEDHGCECEPEDEDAVEELDFELGGEA